MIPTPAHAHIEADGRFQVMLAMFAFDTPHTKSSLLCRVLDGRELDGVCPVDEAILSPEERARYKTVRNPRQRALAFRARAELRRMLGREIGLAPQSVPLECDAHGKPRCPHPRAAGLDFSITHADDCAIVALGEADGVGVDAEMIVDEEPSDELLEILFNADELDQWLKLPSEDRRRAFTEAWTIKEACLKALGTGLDGSPHETTVRFNAAGHAVPDFANPNWICERVNFCSRYSACCVVILPAWENPRHALAA
jgi:4'-phosphopantetheinyl transferase